MRETLADDLAASLDEHGFAVARALMPAAEVERARQQTRDVACAGVRDPLAEFGSLPEIANLPVLCDLAAAVVGVDAFVARSILFDKTADRNWPVAPHQDTTIAVGERVEVPDFGPWSVKNDVVHVRPPRSVLESMVTFRIALDAAPAENGALRVLPGSHRSGVLRSDDLESTSDSNAWVTCQSEPGDVLLMRPLLVHASPRSERPGRRRVLHTWNGRRAGCRRRSNGPRGCAKRREMEQPIFFRLRVLRISAFSALPSRPSR